MKVNVFVWKASKEQIKLAERVALAIQKDMESTMEFQVWDLSSYTPDPKDNSPAIIFGQMAATQVANHNMAICWRMPDLDKLEPKPENKKDRASATNKLPEIARTLEAYYKQTKESWESKVEVENATVGVGVGDIQLSQSEIDNLLKIKELLGGGTIVLKKGDIKIEVSNGDKAV
jgi:hypothetical protein